jgi:hypothetical protein
MGNMFKNASSFLEYYWSFNSNILSLREEKEEILSFKNIGKDLVCMYDDIIRSVKC